MMMKYLTSLALVALLLPACSAHVDNGSSDNSAADNSATSSASDNSASSDNSAAAPSPADSSDPLAQYLPTFQKMESATDNDFADILTDKKDGPQTIASLGFYPQYPCTVATNADKSKSYGYCIMGVSASKANVDDDYAAAKDIITKGDPTLKPGTAPAPPPKSIAQSEFENDTHAVYLFESQQDNGKYIVKMTFAKPAAMK
jgi:hypothetical protein